MNDIAPVGRPNYTAMGGTARRGATQAAPINGTQRGGDEVQLSDTARLLSQLRQMPDVRQNKIDQVRQAIDDGSYDTEDKVDAILDPLMEDLA
jgi:flagellar biosynthesis anti-sigma factor FlgM